MPGRSGGQGWDLPKRNPTPSPLFFYSSCPLDRWRQTQTTGGKESKSVAILAQAISTLRYASNARRGTVSRGTAVCCPFTLCFHAVP